MKKDLIVINNLKNLLLNIYNEYRKYYGETVANEELGEMISVVFDELKGVNSGYSTDKDFQQLKEFAKNEVRNAYEFLLEYTDEKSLRKEFTFIMIDIIGDNK